MAVRLELNVKFAFLLLKLLYFLLYFADLIIQFLPILHLVFARSNCILFLHWVYKTFNLGSLSLATIATDIKTFDCIFRHRRYHFIFIFFFLVNRGCISYFHCCLAINRHRGSTRDSTALVAIAKLTDSRVWTGVGHRRLAAYTGL